MAIIKCKMCGGDLVLIEGQSVVECEYCGSKQTVPTVDNEKKLTLFVRANRLRAACEFDKAAGIYEAIVADFPEEAEAYWGLVLCKYGIEYVDDPATGKKIPTCHRSSFDSIMEDSDFEQALENADSVARRVYREEAKQIEEIRKGIIVVSANEQPYDIFICYKETDENGDRTLDSVLAQDIYDALTEKSYRTFFARISLEDKLGVEYEPYIFAALNSAKIMLAVGTDYEFYNAVWVKNEWSRYLKMMTKDKNKHLIPCFKNLDAYDMPREFAKLQAQDLGKVGAMQDLLRGIEKMLPKRAELITPSIVSEPAASPTIMSLLKRVFLFLEDGDWDSADAYCEKVLDIDPENPLSYLGKLMSELRVKKQEDLMDCKTPFDDHKFYKKIVRFCDDKLKAELEGYIFCINQRLEEERIAREKQDEETRISQAQLEEQRRIVWEKKKEESGKQILPIRQKLKPAQHLLALGDKHVVGLKEDGTVVATGSNIYGQCNVNGWKDMIAVAAGELHTVGLRASGLVIAVGYNEYGQCDVISWRNIVAIAAGNSYTVGLRSDGTVVAVGYNKNGRCNVSDWKDIVGISAGFGHTVGVRSDGTVVATGENEHGQCNVSDWKNIVAVAAGFMHTVGLKADGTVVATGNTSMRQCDVSDWWNIVEISARSSCTVGLRANGTVEAVASHDQDGQCNVFGWKNMVAIAAGTRYTVGIHADGTVVATGLNEDGQCNVGKWRLFNNVENLEQAHIAAKHRVAGLCQHCGASFKGLISKKCVNCGKPKDY